MSNISRITKSESVLVEARKRIDYLLDEFDKVVIAFSGGKDSTATLELALERAKLKNKLPLDVMFIDQEGEFSHAIEYIRRIKERTDEVKMWWYQIPIKINVSSNSVTNHLFCWDPDAEDVWIRPHEPDAITENTYCKEDTYFNDLFNAIIAKDFAGYTVALLGGVRTEESPKRLSGLTKGNVYKGITWGKKLKTEGMVSLYPIYDWSYTDVWKYIAENNFDYCKIYDLMYSIGLSTSKMRVSSLFHENSVGSFSYLAEVEKDNWNRIVQRIYGANTYKTSASFYECPDQLPYMFKTWEGYAGHLFDKLISEQLKPVFENHIKNTHARFLKSMKKYPNNSNANEDRFWQVVATTYLKNDFCFTLLTNLLIRLNMNM